MAQVPFYKKKFSRARYLENGLPRPITPALIPTIEEWVDVTQEELDLWEDAKEAVYLKNKKREYCITPSKKEETRATYDKSKNLFTQHIEILHADYQGFTYDDADACEEELDRRFWPTVFKLISHFISPKLKVPPPRLN